VSAIPDNSNDRGRRAEEVAQWYFRLNGFLQTGFVLHDDQPHRQVTEADVLAVRFPHSEESLRDIRVTDHQWIREVTPRQQTLFVIAEVTQGGPCKVNDPWRDPSSSAMEKAIRRLGFALPEKRAGIAKAMYDRLRWPGDNFVLQFLSIGDRTNDGLSTRYQDLVQLTWDGIAGFLWDRFHAFGQIKGWPPQWPEFGRTFAQRVESGEVSSAQQAVDCVATYIQDGR